MKSILGLILLLAWPGPGTGGRAEGNFALNPPALAPERSSAFLGLEGPLAPGGCGTDEALAAASAPATGTEPAPFAPAGPPPGQFRPHDILPLSSGNGGSSTGSSPSGSAPGSGVGLSFILPPGTPILRPERWGRLFLADEHFRPPPFASRLFRPPR